MEPLANATHAANPADPVTATPTAKPMAICTIAQVPDFNRSLNIVRFVIHLRIILN